METLKKPEYWWLKLTIVVITLFSFSVISIQSRELSQLGTKIKNDSTSNSKIIDSLNTELFIQKNIVGRYDMTLDSLKIVNPKAEIQFQEILNSGQYE